MSNIFVRLNFFYHILCLIFNYISNEASVYYI